MKIILQQGVVSVINVVMCNIPNSSNFKLYGAKERKIMLVLFVKL